MAEWSLAIIGVLGGGIGVALVTWISQRGREPIEQDSIQVTSANAAVTAIASSNNALREDVMALREELKLVRDEMQLTRKELGAEKDVRRRFEVQFQQAVKQLVFVHDWIDGGMREPVPPRPDWLDDYHGTGT